MSKQLFSSGDAARRLNISRETVLRYYKQGILKGFSIVNGRVLFDEETLVAFEQSRKQKEPALVA